MSKLAHSNEETMQQIETTRLQEEGILCTTCHATVGYGCGNPICPHKAKHGGRQMTLREIMEAEEPTGTPTTRSRT